MLGRGHANQEKLSISALPDRNNNLKQALPAGIVRTAYQKMEGSVIITIGTLSSRESF
jgi:hypothetical protein